MKLSESLPKQGTIGATGLTGPTGSLGPSKPTVGFIAVWSGTLASIPAGWRLCDGSNGTPDLRDKFVKGAAAGDGAGGTGGAATHTHNDHAAQGHTGAAVANHSALTHSGAATATHPSYIITSVSFYPTVSLNTGSHSVTQANQHAADTHTVTQASDHAAKSHVAANNLPAYYAVAFIMYVGA